MTIYNLHLPTETAERSKILLDRVLPHARTEHLECSFLLSVASMLICQTNDKVRKPEYAACSTEVARVAFKKALETNLSSFGSSSDLRLDVRSTESRWGALRDLEPDFATFVRGPEEMFERRPECTRTGTNWQTGTLFKHLRNGIAHGNVWWGPEPKRRGNSTRNGDFRIGEHVSLIFIMSRHKGEECACCHSAFCQYGKSTVTWQATRFTVATLEACLRFWCDLLIKHQIPTDLAADELTAA